MIRWMLTAIWILGPALAAPGEEGSAAPRAAATKALPLLLAGALGHRENRSCFSCHNQGVPIMALAVARERGIAIDGEELHFQLEYIADFLGRNRAAFLAGNGTGGKADTAGYALATLAAGNWPADENTAPVVECLLKYHSDRDHWASSSNRPPSEASVFTTNFVALRGIRHYATTEQKERADKRVAQVRAWLEKSEAEAKDTEDRVFRLRALKEAGAEEEHVAAATKALLVTQQPDGGWRQLDTLASDAYATGTALVALREAGGLAPSDPVYRRGVEFLLKTQQADGSWQITSRSKPFQKYFESGFPHGKDQFISSAATAWAALALLPVEP